MTFQKRKEGGGDESKGINLRQCISSGLGESRSAYGKVMGTQLQRRMGASGGRASGTAVRKSDVGCVCVCICVCV